MQYAKKTRDERQEEARVKWIKNKCCGTLVQPTGTGKTVTALKCLKSFISKYPKTRYIVIVPTDNLKDQWYQQLDSWGLSLNGSVLVINSASTHKFETDILVIDECHRCNSDLFRNIFTNIKYKWVLGLTATFERLDEKHKEVMEKYCPVIDRIPLQEALFNNWVAPYKEYQVLLDVDDIDTLNQLNKEFVVHFEFFGFQFDKVMSLLGPKGFIERAKLRDEMCGPNASEERRKEVFKSITFHSQRFMQVLQARKKFINNHSKKLEIARKIINARSFSKIITFSNTIDMAEQIGIGEVYSSKDTKKRAKTNLEEFNKKVGFAVLNTSKKLDEGADVRGLSVAIMLGIDSSEIKAVQRRGRCIRFEEGKQAEIFNLIINNSVECEWFKKSHAHDPYITIDEQGLEDVLAGKEPKPYVKKVKDFTFRF